MKSKEWYKRKSKDQFIKKALNLGYVSRSAFKLIEIDKKFHLINYSNYILELGSSPGGWTQFILKKKINKNFFLVCVDKIDLKISLPNNSFFIKGNFYDENIIHYIKEKHTNKFDLILSDIAPNSIGHAETDHLKIIQTAEEILDLSSKFLIKSGNLIIKIYQGSREKDFVLKLKENFMKVSYFKPQSSRKSSPEIYLVALNYQLG